MGTADARRDVGAMLRRWRLDRDPGLVPGLAAARGSRSRGYLTQLDMATLLGVSERWYRGLEAGEERTYKATMAAGIARVLDLADDQAEVLWRHCGLEPPRAVAAAPDPVLVDMVRQQPGALSYLSDEAWDVVTCNRLAGLHCPWVARPGANIMLWAFSPDARYQMRDWERAWAVPMLSELRAAWQRTPRHERLDQVVAEVRDQPGVAELWEHTSRVREPYRGARPMYFPLLSPEPVDVRLLVLGLYRDTALRWIVMVPADPRAAAFA
ncbi:MULTISPECIES: MmyB family transcriptional regulator [Streptomyces]|uniref:MmyB family transcriptional regulator n=1 Tax=Streptomyces TaxID=1883 RepID=UPI00039D3DAF|nr:MULTISPECIES: helix-turn-helix domain-containing protein [Streptomyces]MBZ6128531.1 helix-turn-helix domain-containing protein [Streptomyces olivaceus]MBZ6128774.1 helix-turn-helix domain-containing protein [Streptomyces olivaceus]MBZ6162883.1 helix-turn-helix domain-containing protein [Streptomyces olivaceus]MBZ6190686.1 helix-turn-helix domain-containing protein [Streptomyces olivaceus]MBZ6212049.1 helix-turn-helix domain-containing protein [Streptomyces olivaceus]